MFQKLLLVMQLSLGLLIFSSAAQADDHFAITLPGWTYQPRAHLREFQMPEMQEFQGLLNKRGAASSTPSIFVLKQSMPAAGTENLEAWFNQKYFKGKGALSWKAPIKELENHQGYVYIFSSKTGRSTVMHLIYTFRVGHELVLLSQTTIPSTVKTDLKLTSTALKHIKFIK